ASVEERATVASLCRGLQAAEEPQAAGGSSVDRRAAGTAVHAGEVAPRVAVRIRRIDPQFLLRDAGLRNQGASVARHRVGQRATPRAAIEKAGRMAIPDTECHLSGCSSLPSGPIRRAWLRTA